MQADVWQICWELSRTRKCITWKIYIEVFCILVKLASPFISYPCVQRMELCRVSPGLLQGRQKGHWRESYRQITKKTEQLLKRNQMLTLLSIKKWESQLRCFHSSICPCQKLEVCFLLQSIFSASLKEDRERGKQCNFGLLTWLSYWQCPRLLSNTPVINFTKDPLPSDYFFSNTLACQDKEWLFAESKNESVRVQGAVKSLLGHTAEHCQIWHGVDMSKLLRDFTQIFLGEMTEALHRGLEVVLEGSCVVFQTHLWKC